jgi:hypothetical protein
LQGVITRCLEKDPARRFGDVADFSAALVPFASPERVASADLIARILGREPPPRVPIAELDSAVESQAPKRQRIPGVRARWPYFLLGVLMLGAGALAGVILLRPERSDELVLAADAGILASSETDALAASGQSDGGAARLLVGPSPDAGGTSATMPEHPAGKKPAHLGAGDTGPHLKPIDPRRVPHTPGDPRDIDPPGIGDRPVER